MAVWQTSPPALCQGIVNHTFGPGWFCGRALGGQAAAAQPVEATAAARAGHWRATAAACGLAGRMGGGRGAAAACNRTSPQN